MQEYKKNLTVILSGASSYNAVIKLIKALLAVSIFAGLTFVGADIRIPLQPVPITLQTLFVFLAGAILGTMRGSSSQLLYILIGAMGAPIFAGHASGLAVLSGPTGGYLYGFVAAPAVIAFFIGRKSSLPWIMIGFSLGAFSILALGTIHLTFFYTHNFIQAMKVGFLPFIPGEILKVAAATSIYRSFKALSRAKIHGRGEN